MPPRANKQPNTTPKSVYNKLRFFVVIILLGLFGVVVVADVVNSLFLGKHYEIDPLFYGLIGTLITVVFVGKLRDTNESDGK